MNMDPDTLVRYYDNCSIALSSNSVVNVNKQTKRLGLRIKAKLSDKHSTFLTLVIIMKVIFIKV